MSRTLAPEQLRWLAATIGYIMLTPEDLQDMPFEERWEIFIQ